MTSLRVSDLRSNSFGGAKEGKCERTIWTSQVDLYCGVGGLLLNTPFINREIRGWFPRISPFLGSVIADTADLAVLIVSYLRALSYEEVTKSRTLVRGGS